MKSKDYKVYLKYFSNDSLLFKDNKKGVQMNSFFRTAILI